MNTVGCGPKPEQSRLEWGSRTGPRVFPLTPDTAAEDGHQAAWQGSLSSGAECDTPTSQQTQVSPRRIWTLHLEPQRESGPSSHSSSTWSPQAEPGLAAYRGDCRVRKQRARSTLCLEIIAEPWAWGSLSLHCHHSGEGNQEDSPHPRLRREIGGHRVVGATLGVSMSGEGTAVTLASWGQICTHWSPMGALPCSKAQ